MPNRLLTASASLALLLVAAPAASASQVSTRAVPNGLEVRYSAKPGEVNAVVLTGTETSIDVTDPGATITSTVPACKVSPDGHTATCTTDAGTPLTGVGYTLADGDDTLDDQSTVAAFGEGGNGNDSVTTRTASISLAGQAGNDSLTGGPGDDVMQGGVDDDQATMGAGSDVFDGGFGNDRALLGDGKDTADGGAGRDDLDGEAGRDFIVATSEPGPVSITFDGVVNDGMPDDRDNLRNFESIVGSPFNDTLVGDAAYNTIEGFGGDDRIDGGAGSDVLNGGDGADTILMRDGAGDFADCGDGRDTTEADAVDERVNCEAVDVRGPAVTVKLPSKLTARRLLRGVSVQVLTNEPAITSLSLVGSARRATLAKAGDVSLAEVAGRTPTTSQRLKLKVPRRLASSLRGRHTLRLIARSADAGGNVRTVSRKLRLRR